MNVFKQNEGMLVPSGFYNAAGVEISAGAFHALMAVAMLPTIGKYAAMHYAIKNGSTYRLFTLARQLHAVNKFDMQ